MTDNSLSAIPFAAGEMIVMVRLFVCAVPGITLVQNTQKAVTKRRSMKGSVRFMRYLSVGADYG